MRMKSIQSRLFGSFVTLGSLLIIVVILVLCAGLFVLRINNYHHAEGIVEHKKQYKLVSQVEGTLKEVHIQDGDAVKEGDTLFTYFSEANIAQANSLDANLKFLNSELKILKKMVRIGSMSPLKVKEKELEIDRIKYEKKILMKSVITAPSTGKISFSIHPQYIHGAYIKPGQILAFIYENQEKHVKVSFPNVYSDRFREGSRVVFRYNDPGSLKTAKLTGAVTRKYIDMETKEVHLYCNIDGNRELLEQLKPSTVVKASILINSTSMAEDLLNISVDVPFFSREHSHNE